MTNDIVIRAERLGKKYLIGHAAERETYVGLRDVLVRGAHNLWRKTADMVRGRAIVAVDIAVVVEPDPAHPSFGILVRFGRQLLQCRAVQFEKQAASADAEAGTIWSEPMRCCRKWPLIP